VHGRSLAWVRDSCQVQDAGRPLLYAVAAFADKHEGYCTASYRTLAKAAGISLRMAKYLMPDLVEAGIVERVDGGGGRRPATYRIHPSLWASGATTAPQGDSVVVQPATRSGAMADPVAVQWPFRSGAMPPPLTSGNGPQEKYLEEKSFEDSGGSYEPPGQARPEGRLTADNPNNPRVPPSDWAEVAEAARVGKFPDWLVDAVNAEVDVDAELLTRPDGTQFIQLSDGSAIPNARQALAICMRADT
jgi:hypothetical protein